MDNKRTKEEILNAAKNDNEMGREYEHKIEARGGLVSSLTVLIIVGVLFFVQYLNQKTWNFGLLAVLFASHSSQYLYEGIKTKKVWKTIVSSIEILIAILFIIVFIGQVIK